MKDPPPHSPTSSGVRRTVAVSGTRDEFEVVPKFESVLMHDCILVVDPKTRSRSKQGKKPSPVGRNPSPIRRSPSPLRRSPSPFRRHATSSKRIDPDGGQVNVSPIKNQSERGSRPIPNTAARNDKTEVAARIESSQEEKKLSKLSRNQKTEYAQLSQAKSDVSKNSQKNVLHLDASPPKNRVAQSYASPSASKEDESEDHVSPNSSGPPIKLARGRSWMFPVEKPKTKNAEVKNTEVAPSTNLDRGSGVQRNRSISPRRIMAMYGAKGSGENHKSRKQKESLEPMALLVNEKGIEVTTDVPKSMFATELHASETISVASSEPKQKYKQSRSIKVPAKSSASLATQNQELASVASTLVTSVEDLLRYLYIIDD